MSDSKTGYNEALESWQKKIDEAALSIVPELGKTAILVPYDSTFDSLREPNELLVPITNLAYQFADKLREAGKETDVAINAQELDFERTLTDPHTAHIVVVGHGNLSAVQIARDDKRNRLDWRDISGMADHVKTGQFMQYTCSRLTRKVNVPLGLFAVNNHANVFAAVGRRITPTENIDSLDGSLVPVTKKQKMEYEDILAAFPRQDIVPPVRVQHAIGAVAGMIKKDKA